MNGIKKLLPDVAAIVAFIVIAFVYFYPAVFQGRVLAQHDAVAGIGAGREHQDYYRKHGEATRWTNSLFSGMPTYQIAPGYDSGRTLNHVQELYHLYLPTYVWYVFVMLLGFYILLRAFNFKVWMSALGAIVWAFSSYFFIIIAAGHIWKFVTLAYIPPTIAGMVLVYRGKYWTGGIVTALFASLQLVSNHVQMTYYFLFVMLFMAVAFGVKAWKEKTFRVFVKGTCVLVAAGILAVCVNLSNLYHTYQYSKESMRGKSELVKPQSAGQTGSGLERGYITQWSYGIGETFSLLVPNVKGGASVPLAQNERAMSKANPLYVGLYSQLGQYWGEQPGTSGPVYVGAFVMFLFVLGCFIVKGPMKWALLGGTLFSILLSWGKNFMPLTDFFIDYVPMYNKFRAVSSILVIAEFTIPLLAMLALKEIVERPALLKEKARAFYVSLGLTGGLSILFAIAPRVFFPTYVSTMEMEALQNALPVEHLAAVLTNMEEMRVSIFTADAWRSFAVIAVGVVLLLMYARGRLKATGLVVSLAILCLLDLWAVDKRYLYDAQFVAKGTEMKPFVQPSETDKAILQDTAYYRVLNLASNTFNENETSYWHKSIGGYHAAKLRRYQEVIETYIEGEKRNLAAEVSAAGGDFSQVDPGKIRILNMLNTKYFIFPLQGGGTTPLQNPYAMGNAWFVDEVRYVGNANEELEAVGRTDLRQTAVVDRRFAEEVKAPSLASASDSLRSVTFLHYEPNELSYEVASQEGGTLVFSEIYYPGWQAFVDGTEVPVGRADYLLRAINVPAGRHKVTLLFKPKSVMYTETIAYCAMGILFVGAVALVVVRVRKKA